MYFYRVGFSRVEVLFENQASPSLDYYVVKAYGSATSPDPGLHKRLYADQLRPLYEAGLSFIECEGMQCMPFFHRLLDAYDPATFPDIARHAHIMLVWPKALSDKEQKAARSAFGHQVVAHGDKTAVHAPWLQAQSWAEGVGSLLQCCLQPDSGRLACACRRGENRSVAA